MKTKINNDAMSHNEQIRYARYVIRHNLHKIRESEYLVAYYSGESQKQPHGLPADVWIAAWAAESHWRMKRKQNLR